MSQVVIGMDPHKRTATIEVMAGDEAVIAGRRAQPFWSSRSRAEKAALAVAAYRGMTAEQIDLAVWETRWLAGLERDGMLVGLNWSGERATGYDVEPTDVVRALNPRRQR